MIDRPERPAPVVLVEVRRAPERRALRLAWSDGHAADFDWDYLRGWCPCAVCQGHSVVKMVFHPPPGPVEPVEIAPVGNYGISIAWSDGHSTGIYRFEFLRDLCPCAECRSRGPAQPETRQIV
jgi:DUF971 family protein